MIKSGNFYFHSKVYVTTRTFFSVIIRGTFISFAMQNPRILFLCSVVYLTKSDKLEGVFHRRQIFRFVHNVERTSFAL